MAENLTDLSDSDFLAAHTDQIDLDSQTVIELRGR